MEKNLMSAKKINPSTHRVVIQDGQDEGDCLSNKDGRNPPARRRNIGWSTDFAIFKDDKVPSSAQQLDICHSPLKTRPHHPTSHD